MPQLNPSPWFIIMIFTWLTLLFLMPSKILNYNYPFQPLLNNMKKLNTLSWIWLWQ